MTDPVRKALEDIVAWHDGMGGTRTDDRIEAARAALAAETKPDLGKCAGCGEEITDYDGVVAYTEGTFCSRACAEAAAERAADTPAPEPTGAADVARGIVARISITDPVEADVRAIIEDDITAALVSYADAHAKDAVAAERERGFSAGILDEQGRWEAGCPEPAPTTDEPEEPRRCEHFSGFGDVVCGGVAERKCINGCKLCPVCDMNMEGNFHSCPVERTREPSAAARQGCPECAIGRECDRHPETPTATTSEEPSR